ncbi:MAG: ribonuclease HII [Candidatus Paceibacterota bacterium]
MILPKKFGVIGIDEVGRGPLAGPVTVSALYLKTPLKAKKEFFYNSIRDSKKINKGLRNSIFLTIRKNRKIYSDIKYAVCSRSAKYIDVYGITKATQECIDWCVNDLKRQGVPIESCMIRTDAGIRVNNVSLRQKSYIKGDERFTEIALASIVAKETRDRYMRALSKSNSEYAWDKNVGYGTKDHRNAIGKHGITKYHRISYLKAFKLLDKTE